MSGPIRRGSVGTKLRCYWCSHECFQSLPPTHPERWTVDHLIPQTGAGPTVGSCRSCNSTRASLPAETWKGWLKTEDGGAWKATEPSARTSVPPSLAEYAKATNPKWAEDPKRLGQIRPKQR